MADNIYLLETRLSKAQQAALAAVRDVARGRGLTVFLVGGAVRDLIGGAAVRDLDVVVQGNALKLRKDIEKVGGVVAGETESRQALFVRFPGGVRVEIGSTLTVTYPKPGKAVVKPATILDDLRRRDFTANAMALSLNEGSYGLLMDPLNGVADIENRELRLVSNYGFIEDPVRMIRAARLGARLGWHMDEKTQTRYETGKAEGYISALDEFHRGYEAEEIFHEEDALRVIRRLEEEGWIEHLAPALSSAKANLGELERLRESQAQLQMQGVVADAAATNFPLLTTKMAAKEIEALKRSFPRQGFVREIEGLEAKGKEFAAQLGGKGAALPSQAYKLITSGDPEAVLWVAYTTKSPGLQAKFKSFYTDWPQARQRVPYLLMQEMRITPDLPEYEAITERIFFELMDGKLGTPEEIKAFLEPYSPPAPPPPVSLRRPRAAKKDAKSAKSRKKAAEPVVEEAEVAAKGESSPVVETATETVAAPPALAKGKAERTVAVEVPSGAAEAVGGGSDAMPAEAVAPKVKHTVSKSKDGAGAVERVRPEDSGRTKPTEVQAVKRPVSRPASKKEVTKTVAAKKSSPAARMAPGKKAAAAKKGSAAARKKAASPAKGPLPKKKVVGGKAASASKVGAKGTPAKIAGKKVPPGKAGARAKKGAAKKRR